MNAPRPSFDLQQTRPRETEALMRAWFPFFTQRCFGHLNPRTPLHWGPYLDLLTTKLDACRRGELKRLIVCLPPRHLKSICASVALPAYWLGQDPSSQLMCVSYAQDLALKHARDCREVMTSPWYRKLFPGTRLTQARGALEEFTTTQGGGRLATSVGGVLTGRGADVLIIDDPLKPQEALSEVQRGSVNDWFSNTLYSRLNHKETGCIILVMQRLHQDDLVGHVLEREPWEVVAFPAIAEAEERHRIPGLPGLLDPVEWTREEGSALNPTHESLETLQRIQKAMSSFDWSCQYQQSPVPTGGGLIQDAWWQIYEEPPRPFARIIQSWDTACKASELSDYSVCTTWGEKSLPNGAGRREQHFFLLDVFRRRMNYPDLRRAVLDQKARFEPHVLLIEDRASGTQLIQDLTRDGVRGIRACQPTGDKVMRLHAQTYLVEHGLVHLPEKAPWLAEFRKELAAFPRSKHDDQVDSMSQALAWAKDHRVVDWSGARAINCSAPLGMWG